MLNTFAKPLTGYSVPEFLREDPKILQTEGATGTLRKGGKELSRLGGLRGIGQKSAAVAGGVTTGNKSSSVHF